MIGSTRKHISEKTNKTDIKYGLAGFLLFGMIWGIAIGCVAYIGLLQVNNQLMIERFSPIVRLKAALGVGIVCSILCGISGIFVGLNDAPYEGED